MSTAVSNNTQIDPSSVSGNQLAGQAATAVLASFLFILFEALKKEDESAGNREIANGQAEQSMGVGVEELVYNAQTVNPTTVTMNCGDAGVITGTGHGTLGADANLVQNVIAAGKNAQSFITAASTQYQTDTQNATQNENQADGVTQTFPTAMSADSDDDKATLSVEPDIMGIMQQVTSAISQANPY